MLEDEQQEVVIVEQGVTKSYVKELCESGFKLVIFFYIILFVLFLTSLNACSLNLDLVENNLLDVCVINVNGFNVLFTILTIINLFKTRRFRKVGIPSTKMGIYLYLLIPIGVAAFVYVIILASEMYSRNMCLYSSFTKYLSLTELFFIASAILVLENDMKLNSEDLPWLERSVHKLTVSLLVVGCANTILLEIFLQTSASFKKDAHKYFNITFNVSSTCDPGWFLRVNVTSKLLFKFLGHSLQLLCTLIIFYIVTVTKKSPQNCRKKYMFNSVTTVLLCVVIITLSLLPVVAYVIQLVKTGLNQNWTIYILIAVLVVKILLSVTCILVTKTKFNAVFKWSPKETSKQSANMFDKCFTWIGCLGQLMALGEHVGYASHQLSDYITRDSMEFVNGHTDVNAHVSMLLLIYPSYLLMVFQMLYQTALIEIVIDRKWQENNSGGKSIYPCTVMMCINVAYFIICSYEDLPSTHSLMRNNMMMKSFSSFIKYPTLAIRMAQHLHAAIYFYLLSKISEFNPEISTTSSEAIA